MRPVRLWTLLVLCETDKPRDYFASRDCHEKTTSAHKNIHDAAEMETRGDILRARVDYKRS